MYKKTSLCLLSVLFSASAFAQYWGPSPALIARASVNTAISNSAQAAQDEQMSKSALDVDFELSHVYELLYNDTTELDECDWETIPLYIYQASPNEPDATEEDGEYYIESETPLPGRTLLRKTQLRLPRPYSEPYTMRVQCKAYALTDNWAVMSGTCLNPNFYANSDYIVISGRQYDPQPINIQLKGNINVEGKPVSTYYHSAALTLLYARPGTALSKVLAQTPKVNLRIINSPEEMLSVAKNKLKVNGKERTLTKRPQGQSLTLDESGLFTVVAGHASDALFYQKNGANFIVAFNDGKIRSVPNIDPDIFYRWNTCSREKSSSYHMLAQTQLNFIRSKTGRDWNTVRQHVWVAPRK